MDGLQETKVEQDLQKMTGCSLDSVEPGGLRLRSLCGEKRGGSRCCVLPNVRNNKHDCNDGRKGKTYMGQLGPRHGDESTYLFLHTK